jgi:PHD/YefM family antitoxin component YafN of YafNO toxin-antitoxin module
MALTPQILEKDGEKQFVILPYEEYVRVQEALEDFEDLKTLRAEKEASRDEQPIPLAEVKKELGLK